ncbi:hypothetical protein ACFJIW_16740 [Tahibacter sp. UC22_41]|uniref:hypothetical protein n=1 Tax=Tahibacter sp. UC22_41 TaxID=3350178 RepID=UPI0036D80390
MQDDTGINFGYLFFMTPVDMKPSKHRNAATRRAVTRTWPVAATPQPAPKTAGALTMKSSFSTSYSPQPKAASSLVHAGRRDNALQHGLPLPHRAVDADLLRTGPAAAKDRS